MTKTIVGFIFTDQPLRQLQQLGFELQQNNETLMYGYRQNIIYLSAEAGLGLSLELREVLDEELYFKFDRKNKFEPFESQLAVNPAETKHTNTVFQADKILDEKMENGPLKEQLKTRKIHPIWAIWLKSKDLSFLLDSEAIGKKNIWLEQNVCWVQLGESCFDLLIST